MIRIISRNDGFRRCGVAHSVNPTDWPDDRFSVDELEILLNEPMLMVKAIADPVVIEAGDDDLDDMKTEAVIVADEPVVDPVDIGTKDDDLGDLKAEAIKVEEELVADASIADKAEELPAIDSKATKASKK
jgi:hypothetical protein